jgi:hypothetical protein
VLYERVYAPPPVDLPESRTDNPFWDIVRTIPGNSIEWEYEHRWEPEHYQLIDGAIRFDRKSLCGQYAWSIPDPDTLDFVAKWLSPQSVEIGAGVGYWAWQLSQLGVDMIAYDIDPPQHTGQNHYHSPRNADESKLLGITREVFFDVRVGNHLMAAKHPDRTLFLCWPPYSDDMANKTLKAYKGNRLVYIGESAGGCTGEEWFFKRLGRSWEEIDSHKPMQWWGIHDRVYVYERRVSNA